MLRICITFIKCLLYWPRDSHLQYWADLRVHKHVGKIYKIEYLSQKYWVFELEQHIEHSFGRGALRTSFRGPLLLFDRGRTQDSRP